MIPADRLARAIERMDPDQLWALRIVAATERRARTHYQRDSSDPPTLKAAQEWALENVR